MKTTARLLRLMLPYWRWILLSIFLSTATIASGIGLIGTSTYLISKASMKPSIAVLQVAIVGVRFFGISRGIFRYLERLVSHAVNLQILSKLRRWLYEKLEPLSPAIHQSHQSGDLLSKATVDIDILENFFIRVFSPIIVAILITSGMGLFIGYFQWKLALVLVAGLLISGLFIPLSSTLFRMRRDENLSQQRGDLSGAVIENIQGLSDILAYNKQNIKFNNISEMADKLESTQNKIALGESLIEALSQFFPHLTLFVSIIIAVPLIGQGNIEDIMLGVIVLMVLASFEAVQPLGKTAQNLEQSFQAGNRLFSIGDLNPEVASPTSPENLPLSPLIRFNNLTFSYPGSDQTALSDINFMLNNEKKIGLIGPSGAGKSTIFNLLFRFWDIQPDMILLDDKDIRYLDPEDVRSQFAVVSQDSTFLAGSIQKILPLASPAAEDERLNRVLQQVNLDSWVDQLPNQIDTWIGEHGIKISGGEFTRLLIARAMLRSAPIWILDEPTAHLDAVNENKITQLLHEVTKDKSTIWATHQLNDIQNLDQIFVFDKGHIIERGNHQDLLNLQGNYYKLGKPDDLPIIFCQPGLNKPKLEKKYFML